MKYDLFKSAFYVCVKVLCPFLDVLKEELIKNLFEYYFYFHGGILKLYTALSIHVHAYFVHADRLKLIFYLVIIKCIC